MFNWIYILVDIGFVTALFYEYPPYIAYPPFSNFDQHPHSPQYPPPPLLFLWPCFIALMGDCATFDVLLYLISWIYTCRSLAP